MTVKRFRIEGQVYLAETPDSAYAQHMTRWRDVSREMAGGFVPLVPVFQEHPERAVELDEVFDEMSALEKGKRIHKGLERLFEGLPTQEEMYRFMLKGLSLREKDAPIVDIKSSTPLGPSVEKEAEWYEGGTFVRCGRCYKVVAEQDEFMGLCENHKGLSHFANTPEGALIGIISLVSDVEKGSKTSESIALARNLDLNRCTRCYLDFMRRPPAYPRTGFCPRCGLPRMDETHEQPEEALKREQMWFELEKNKDE